MKKIFLSLTVLIAAFGSQAQNDGYAKGNRFLSGGFSLSSYNDKDTDEKASSFSISPRVGYFVSDHVAAGIGIGFGSQTAQVGSTDTKETNTLKLGAFARYYTNPAERFSVFAHLGFDYMTEDDKITEVKENGMDAFISPGISYFVRNNLAIEATFGRLGYSATRKDIEGVKGSNVLDLDINLTSLSFGMAWKF